MSIWQPNRLDRNHLLQMSPMQEFLYKVDKLNSEIVFYLAQWKPLFFFLGLQLSPFSKKLFLFIFFEIPLPFILKGTIQKQGRQEEKKKDVEL